MSLLELLGIVFLAMVVINAFVGVWAVKTANSEEEYTVSYGSGH
jgi:Na+/proline symporter